jgi:hypothetical protein
MSELSMRVRGFAYDLHSVADCVEALEAEVENYRQAAKKAMKLAEDALARIPDLEGRARWLETLNHVAPPALPKEATDERA